ncbi:MAG: hypothetical protein ABIQ02_06675 [Saprospiraceae bacterium]
MKTKMNMRHFGPRRILFFLLFAPLAILAIGGIVMLLWNAILPTLLHVGMISFWQAIGLLVLSKILFSSFRPGGRWHRFGPPDHMREKLMNMSEEERAVFREQWRSRCGGWHEEKSLNVTSE